MLLDTEPTPIALSGQPADGKQIAAVYRCRLKPELLEETDHADIKYCAHCKQNVFKVIDFDGLQQAVASKGCVWGPNDIGPIGGEPMTMFLGAPIVEYHSGRTLSWDE